MRTLQKRAQSGKWALVDVRMAEAYALGHAEGALSAPMYVTITPQADMRKMMKFLMLKANGVNPVDENKQVKGCVCGGGGAG